MAKFIRAKVLKSKDKSFINSINVELITRFYENENHTIVEFAVHGGSGVHWITLDEKFIEFELRLEKLLGLPVS